MVNNESKTIEFNIGTKKQCHTIIKHTNFKEIKKQNDETKGAQLMRNVKLKC